MSFPASPLTHLEELTDEYFFGQYVKLFPDYTDEDIVTACQNFVHFYTMEGVRASLEDCRCLIYSLRDCNGERLISPDCFSSPPAEPGQTSTDKLATLMLDGNALVPSSRSDQDVKWYKLIVKRLQSLQPSEIYDTGAPRGSDLMPLSLLDINSLPGAHLVSYIGFILIKCIGLALRGDFSNTAFPDITKKFNDVWNQDISIPTPPPHAQFLHHLKTVFQRRSPQGNAILAPLVWTMKNPPPNVKVEVLQKDVLEPLSNNFTIVLERYEKLGSNLDKICDMSNRCRDQNNIKCLFDSAINVNKIYDKLRYEVTWKWVHMFTDRYLTSLSIGQYSVFTLTCYALEVDCQPKDPIWQSDIIRPYLIEMNTAITLAKKIKRWRTQEASEN